MLWRWQEPHRGNSPGLPQPATVAVSEYHRLVSLKSIYRLSMQISMRRGGGGGGARWRETVKAVQSEEAQKHSLGEKGTGMGQFGRDRPVNAASEP